MSGVVSKQSSRPRGVALVVAGLLVVALAAIAVATSLGATDTVHAADGVDVVAEVRERTRGGPDYAFEAIGSERAIQQAWASARARSRTSTGSSSPISARSGSR